MLILLASLTPEQHTPQSCTGIAGPSPRHGFNKDPTIRMAGPPEPYLDPDFSHPTPAAERLHILLSITTSRPLAREVAQQLRPAPKIRHAANAILAQLSDSGGDFNGIHLRMELDANMQGWASGGIEVGAAEHPTTWVLAVSRRRQSLPASSCVTSKHAGCPGLLCVQFPSPNPPQEPSSVRSCVLWSTSIACALCPTTSQPSCCP